MILQTCTHFFRHPVHALQRLISVHGLPVIVETSDTSENNLNNARILIRKGNVPFVKEATFQ